MKRVYRTFCNTVYVRPPILCYFTLCDYYVISVSICARPRAKSWRRHRQTFIVMCCDQLLSGVHGRQRHWNIGGRRSSAEDARIEAP